jgi:lipoate-protein ligase A
VYPSGRTDLADSWRLLSLKASDGFANMAVDEAVLTARIKSSVPNTLRFYRWIPSTVSVGRFQNVEDEVQLDNCRKEGVNVVRRITGGGTVYHDREGEITYSVVAKTQDLGTADIGLLYARLYGGLTEALRTLGVESDFCAGTPKACPNLTVRGKKISGSAQTHRGGVVLQHGTLLLEVNLEKMFTFLRVPWARTRTQVITAAREKITSVDEELGRRITIEESAAALTKGFSRALNVELVNGELTPYEADLAAELLRDKYSYNEWNLNGESSSV